MTFVIHFAIVKRMKNTPLTLSSKYQLVIPKTARKKMGLVGKAGQRFQVTRVSEDEIVFRKEPTLDDFLGKFGASFPKNAAAALRKMRDEEWD